MRVLIFTMPLGLFLTAAANAGTCDDADLDRDGNITRPGARSSYAADIGDAANMTARVRALGVVLEKFSADIADELRARAHP